MTKLEFLHPKFIPTWILLFVMRIIVFIPWKIQFKIAKMLTPLLQPFLHKKVKIAKVNIEKCFPNINKTEQKQLLHKHFSSLIMGVFETANCFYMSDNRLKKIYKFDNKNILQNQIDKNNNIILVASHFIMLFLALRIISQNFKVACIYRPQNNKLFHHAMKTSFKRNNIETISTKNSKKIIKTLKQSTPIIQSLDQDLSVVGNVFALFFNIQTNTITATAKLAKLSNASTIYFDFYRGNKLYKLNFTTIDNYPTKDDVADATKLNSHIEKQIKKTPEQYLWVHRRFKTRPNAEKSFYS